MLTMQNSTVSGNTKGGVRLQNANAVITFSTPADNDSGENLGPWQDNGGPAPDPVPAGD